MGSTDIHLVSSSEEHKQFNKTLTDIFLLTGFDCANPQTWPDDALPTGYADSHAAYGADTPFSILEFQGGSFDPWGGWGFAQCQELVNYEFQRVFCKSPRIRWTNHRLIRYL